jgi:hypothetical protein
LCFITVPERHRRAATTSFRALVTARIVVA